MTGPHESLSERRAALSARYPSWQPRTLAGHLAASAEEFAERPYVLTDAHSYSYREMWQWARQLAGGLIASGVQPGDHVAMVMANYPEFVACKYAIASTGAVAVPLNYRFRAEELRYVIEQSDAALLITMAGFRELPYTDMLDAMAPGWDTPEGSPAFPALRGVITFRPDGSVARPGVPTLAELAERGARVAATDLAARQAAVAPDHICDVVYTSGTTGFPKGAMLTHDAMLRCSYSSAHIRAFEDGRRILFSLPLYHVFAYAEGMLAAPWVGGAIAPQLEFDPIATFSAIERHGVAEALFVPTMSATLVEHPARHDYDLSSLYAVMSAAAPAPVRLWEQLRAEFGVTEVVTAYGQTETAASTTYTMPDDPLELTSATVGRAKPGDAAGVEALGGLVTMYKTVDPVTGEDLPDGTTGELAVAGPQLMRGYYGKPEETAAVLSGGWLRSGDLGVIREDGYIVLTGRSKDLYKRGAELVSPKEVEELLSGRPDVAQAYVVGVPDELWGEVGVAFVVPAAGAEPVRGGLLGHCRESLARFKVPEQVILITAEELPTTPTGKVQKFRLAERAQAETGGVAAEGAGEML
jgi:fatty-acyl-CoA synthase